MLLFDSSSGLDALEVGYKKVGAQGAVTHIDFIRGGYKTVPSSSDIINTHPSRLEQGQIIYTLFEDKTYIIKKFFAFTPDPDYYYQASDSSSISEFYFPTSNIEGSGVGFPYAGSDAQYGNPSQAIITGSLLLSGSGNITASNISATNLTLSNNLNVGGTLSFDGFNFTDGTISILSGSNIFGSGSSNTHKFTGSLLVSGGTHLINGDLTISGSLDILGDFLLNGDAELDHVKINASNRGVNSPILEVISGSSIAFQVTNEGIIQLEDYATPDVGDDFEPTPIKGGIMFRNNEMYIGKD